MRRAFGQDFDVPTGYLNTASIGVPPSFVADELDAVVQRWRTGADLSTSFNPHIAAARTAFASLVGVDPDTVAIGLSVGQLVGLVAASIPDGSRVLVARNDFTSATFPFAAQAHRGVTVTEVDLVDLPSTVDGHDVVAVSVVQSADGAIVDLEALRRAAAAAGARVLLDATQAVGWLPLQLDWADWTVSASYKWLLSPRGAAWLAVRPQALETMVPHSANWFGGENPWTTTYGLPLRLAAGTRRLDLSPAWFSQVGAAAALPWLATLDLAEVSAHCVRLADATLAGLGLSAQGSAIIALDLEQSALDRLAAAGVRATKRAGRLRLAFHLYSNQDDVEMVLAALKG